MDVDYYDVQNMIRDATSGIPREIAEAVRESRYQIDAEIADDRRELVRLEHELGQLRLELGELREQIAAALIGGGTLG